MTVYVVVARAENGLKQVEKVFSERSLAEIYCELEEQLTDRWRFKVREFEVETSLDG